MFLRIKNTVFYLFIIHYFFAFSQGIDERNYDVESNVDRIFASKNIVADINKLDSFLEYFVNNHIWFDKIDGDLASRSIILYMSNIDPLREIFVEKEISRWLFPDRNTISKIIASCNGKSSSSMNSEFYKIDLIYKNEVNEFRIQRAKWRESSITLYKEFLKFYDLASSKIVELEVSGKRSYRDPFMFPQTRDEINQNRKREFFKFCIRQDLYLNTKSNSYEDFVNMIDYYESYKRRIEDEVILNNEYSANKRMERIVSAIIRSADQHSILWSNDFGAPFFLRRTYSLVNKSRSYLPKISLGADRSGFTLYSVEGLDFDKRKENQPLDKGDILRVVDGIDLYPGIPAYNLRAILKGLESEPANCQFIDKEGHSKIVYLNRTKDVFTAQKSQPALSMSIISGESKSDDVIVVISLKKFYVSCRTDNTMGKDHIVTEDSGSQIRDACNKIIEKYGKIDGVILDLRYNTGGLVQGALSLLGLFVGNDHVANVISRNSGFTEILKGKYSVTEAFAKGKQLLDVPTVIMINGLSASCSELVTAVLRERGKCVVVGGKNTFGKSTTQIIAPFSIEDISKKNVFISGIRGDNALISKVFGRVSIGLFVTKYNNSAHLYSVPSDIEFRYSGCKVNISSRKDRFFIDPKKIDNNINFGFKPKESIPYLASIKDKHIDRTSQGQDAKISSEKWKYMSGSVRLDAAIRESINILSDILTEVK